MVADPPAISVTGLSKTYRTGSGEPFHAVRDLDLQIARGEVFAPAPPTRLRSSVAVLGGAAADAVVRAARRAALPEVLSQREREDPPA